jgi:hypothetical protein
MKPLRAFNGLKNLLINSATRLGYFLAPGFGMTRRVSRAGATPAAFICSVRFQIKPARPLRRSRAKSPPRRCLGLAGCTVPCDHPGSPDRVWVGGRPHRGRDLGVLSAIYFYHFVYRTASRMRIEVSAPRRWPSDLGYVTLVYQVIGRSVLLCADLLVARLRAQSPEEESSSDPAASSHRQLHRQQHSTHHGLSDVHRRAARGVCVEIPEV